MSTGIERTLQAPSSSPETTPGSRDATLSLYMLSWILAAPLVGFALAGRVFDLGASGDWELWKAAAIGTLLMIPFAIGAFFGIRAVARGCLRGWIGTIGNVALGAMAIGMPISEALAG